MCTLLQRRWALGALCAWLLAASQEADIPSQSGLSVLQALAEQLGCVDESGSGATCAAELDHEAAKRLFKAWYPLSHHWRLSSHFDPKVHGESETYGELEVEGLDAILERVGEAGAPFSEDDVFLDMGSGVGQVALFVFLKTEARRTVGIELLDDRFSVALEARTEAMLALSKLYGIPLETDVTADTDSANPSALISGDKLSSIINGRELLFLQGDMTSSAFYERWADATVVFTCSPLFDDELIEALYGALVANLQPGALVFTLKALGGNYKDLAPLDVLNVKTSWNEAAKVFLYMRNVEPPALEELNLAVEDSASVMDACNSWAENGSIFTTNNVAQRFCKSFSWKWEERAKYQHPRLDYEWVVP